MAVQRDDRIAAAISSDTFQIGVRAGDPEKAMAGAGREWEAHVHAFLGMVLAKVFRIPSPDKALAVGVANIPAPPFHGVAGTAKTNILLMAFCRPKDR